MLVVTHRIFCPKLRNISIISTRVTKPGSTIHNTQTRTKKKIVAVNQSNKI